MMCTDWQASCPFNLAHKLKIIENFVNGDEMRETEIRVLLRET